MIKRKKIFILLTMFLLALGTASCGGGGGSSTATFNLEGRDSQSFKELFTKGYRK